MSQMFSDVEFVDDLPSLAARKMRRNSLDCISFSNLPQEMRPLLVAALAGHPALIAAAGFRAEHRDSRSILWDSLVPSLISTDGVVLTYYEETPDSTQMIGQRIVFLADRVAEGPADGYFAYYTNTSLIPETRFATISIPGDLAQPPDEVKRSPVAHVVESLGRYSGSRISPVDSADLPAIYVLPPPELQFPDLFEVEKKVRNYLLDKRQSEQKWVGFMSAGYDSDRGGDVELLAALLASALLGAIDPFDCRATADGSLQFSMLVALPRRAGGFAPVLTSWHAGQGKPLTLATAFPTKSERSLSATFSKREHTDIGDLLHGIARDAHAYGEEIALDQSDALPRIWVSQTDPKSNELARWARAQGFGDGGYRRARMGGRTTLMRLPGDYGSVGWLGACGGAVYAQLALAIHGIRTSPETWVD